MCLAFVEFFPRSETFFTCYSMPVTEESLEVLGVNLDKFHDYKIETEGRNMSIKDWIGRNVNWGGNSRGMARRFQEYIENGNNYVMCGTKGKPSEEKKLEDQEAKEEVRLCSCEILILCLHINLSLSLNDQTETQNCVTLVHGSIIAQSQVLMVSIIFRMNAARSDNLLGNGMAVPVVV